MPLRGRKSSLRAVALRFDELEDRQLLSADALSTGFASPGAIGHLLTPAQVATIASESASGVTTPQGSPGPAAWISYIPSQIRHAYGIDQLSQDGTGQTIAIIDAYDQTAAVVASDLAAFSTQFGLPAANLTVATPQGIPSTLNSGWDLEIALDVEWAHAVAPGAKILLVQTATASYNDLLGGVSYAASHGANQISMSWGGGESPGISSFDSYFQQAGITYLASSGDSAGAMEYPAVSPYVVSVGGTNLQLDSSNNRTAESAWSSGGGGLSSYVTQPSYQRGFSSSTQRAVPDVAYDADPATGVYVIKAGQGYGVGGTSAGAPQWAGLIALANQGRVAAGLAPLGIAPGAAAGTDFGTNKVLYQLAGGTSYTNPNGDYLDITSGSNSHPATTGFDLATGLGSPVANKLVPDLVSFGGTKATVGAPSLGDSGFETVSTPAGSFAYDPTGSPWTFAGSSGVSANGSGFTSGNPNAPQGSQVAFLQRTGSFSQSVAGWAAGNYTISFQAAQRGNYGSSQAEDFQIQVDGVVVGTFKPTSTAYATYATASFTVAAGAHTVKFVGLDSVGGDNTAFIDAVSIASVPASSGLPTLGDSGFESASATGAGYAYNPTGSAWTFSGYSGVSANGSGFTSGNPNAPQGSQVAFLQRTGSFSQSVTNWAAGSYTISFQAAQRGNYGTQAEDFQVQVDGVVVGTFTPSSSTYSSYATASFSVAAGAHTIKFVGLDSVGGDNTAFIDAVSIATVPAPSGLPALGDSGFESASTPGVGYVYNPTGSAWTFTGSSGVSANNTGFTSGNPNAPQGSQVAFLQYNGSFSQSVAGWAAGNYTIAFQAAQRGNYGTQTEDFQVWIDAVLVGTFTPNSSVYQSYATASFSVAAGAHTIKFVGLDTVGGDNTAFIDDVSIASA
jgi:hypothetical protein